MYILEAIGSDQEFALKYIPFTDIYVTIRIHNRSPAWS